MFSHLLLHVGCYDNKVANVMLSGLWKLNISAVLFGDEAEGFSVLDFFLNKIKKGKAISYK